MVSVCSNIAEGSSRNSKKDQAHFYNMAYSSLMETLNQLIISHDLGFMNDEKLGEFRSEITSVSMMLNKLCNSTKVQRSEN
jgi:four helix bundle protein